VFVALFEGLKGLRGCLEIHDYCKMIEHIQQAVRARPALLEEVCCNGEPLSRTDVADFRAAVQHTRVADGYCCSFSDPLLTAFCVVFRLNVFHNFAGTATTYKVQGARRSVYLHSTAIHMSHVRNQLLPGSDGPEELAIEDAEDVAVQGTVVSAGKRCEGKRVRRKKVNGKRSEAMLVSDGSE